MTDISEYVFNSETSNRDLLIVTFGGCNKEGSIATIPPFEFVNTLSKYFPNSDKRFYRDLNLASYNRGLKGISSNIDETVSYLEPIVKTYKKVVFIGNSSGGYAAILFGSLLNIYSVIAFFPQTIVGKPPHSKQYHNLLNYVNKLTKYHLFGNPKITKGIHSFEHLERLRGPPNIFIKESVNVKKLRDSGELEKILKAII